MKKLHKAETTKKTGESDCCSRKYSCPSNRIQFAPPLTPIHPLSTPPPPQIPHAMNFKFGSYFPLKFVFRYPTSSEFLISLLGVGMCFFAARTTHLRVLKWIVQSPCPLLLLVKFPSDYFIDQNQPKLFIGPKEMTRDEVACGQTKVLQNQVYSTNHSWKSRVNNLVSV